MTDSEKSAILKQYDKMIYSRINKFNNSRFLLPEDVEELAQDIRLKIWNSLDRYDPSLSGLSTWIYRSINLKISTFRGSFWRNTIKTVDHNSVPFTDLMDYTLDEDKQRFTPSVNDSTSDLSFMMMVESIPNDKDRSYVYRWCMGWSMQEIAEEEVCTRQNIQQQVKKTTRWLLENMDRKKSLST